MPPEAPLFDEIVHAPHRLRICAMLNAAQRVEFGFLVEHLGLSKSVLSKHLSSLEAAGYLEQHRVVRDSRSRVWLALTPEGRRAYESHVAALRQIIATSPRRADPPARAPGRGQSSSWTVRLP